MSSTVKSLNHKKRESWPVSANIIKVKWVLNMHVLASHLIIIPHRHLLVALQKYNNTGTCHCHHPFISLDMRSRKSGQRQSDVTVTHLTKSCTCHVSIWGFLNKCFYTVSAKRVTTGTWQSTTWKPDWKSVIKKSYMCPVTVVVVV